MIDDVITLRRRSGAMNSSHGAFRHQCVGKQVSGIWYQAADIKQLVSDIWYQAADIKQLVSSITHQAMVLVIVMSSENSEDFGGYKTKISKMGIRDIENGFR